MQAKGLEPLKPVGRHVYSVMALPLTQTCNFAYRRIFSWEFDSQSVRDLRLVIEAHRLLQQHH